MRLLWFERTATNPWWTGVKGRFREADNWVTRYLDVGELSHWVEHHWKAASLGAAALLVTLYALSGLRVIAPDEVAVVRRFGQAVEDLPPGWHWRYPWPVDDVTRVSQRLRTVEVGFRDLPGKGAGGVALTWASAHRRENRVQDEAMMITGDGNLVDLLVTVRYKVVDPRAYLFGVRNPDEVIRAAVESELRGMVAGRPFFQLLTLKRHDFQNEALRRVRDACARYRPDGSAGTGGLGAEFDSLAIIDLHPPADVVEAYYDVAKAMERRDQKVNAARERATRKLKGADAESHKIVSRARAAALESTQSAAGDTARFVAQQRARATLSWRDEADLALPAFSALWRGEPAESVEADWARRRERRMAVHRDMTDFRVYWENFGRALSGRDLVLVDSDNVGGRRNLMLFDPDVLRVPFPVWMQPGRGTRMPGQQDEGP